MICCQNLATCPQAKNSSWSCSSGYNDKILSYQVCPFMVSACGGLFGQTEDSQSPTTLNVTLNPGDVCVYWQETSSAIPAFSVQASNTSVIQAFSAGYDNADIGAADG